MHGTKTEWSEGGGTIPLNLLGQHLQSIHPSIHAHIHPSIHTSTHPSISLRTSHGRASDQRRTCYRRVKTEHDLKDEAKPWSKLHSSGRPDTTEEAKGVIETVSIKSNIGQREVGAPRARQIGSRSRARQIGSQSQQWPARLSAG